MSQLNWNQKNAVSQFMQFTETSKDTALRYLRNSRFDFDNAMNAFLTDKTMSDQKQDKIIIEETFRKYSSDKEMDIDGIIAFISDLGLNVEDPIVLALSYCIKSSKIGAINKDEFVKGMLEIHCKTIDDLKHYLETVIKPNFTSTEDDSFFKEVYRFTFGFVKVGVQRALPLDTAVDYWRLLLVDRFQLTESWIEFSETQLKKDVSKDTWNMLYEFLKEYSSIEDLKSYDATAAWPSTIDKYVSYVLSEE
ncbi:hypothetical protein CANCADRAFT_1518 [Tortispora caseinolytica NRRL Y-17796]|uniref:Defective in cullin neddylation protein n=1 Tax=Tortispora caseinolytica NRRL Y-17796 TaxID=767744 RepID=A0A1E4TME9_9ASCO|nr:hypothetical protein CANCADRAFT_1518 [Tortispora caseinolytica NRRL Y-17796]